MIIGYWTIVQKTVIIYLVPLILGPTSNPLTMIYSKEVAKS